MQRLLAALLAHRAAIAAAHPALAGFVFSSATETKLAGQVQCRLFVELEPHTDAALVEFFLTEEITADEKAGGSNAAIDIYVSAVERAPLWVRDENCIVHLQSLERSSPDSRRVALDSVLTLRWKGVASWRG